MTEPSFAEVRGRARDLGISPLSGPGVTKKSLQQQINAIEKGSDTELTIVHDNPWLYNAIHNAIPDIPDLRSEETREHMGSLDLWELANGEISNLTQEDTDFFSNDNILSLKERNKAKQIMEDYPILSYAVAKNRDWWWSIPFLTMTQPHPDWPPYTKHLNDLITNKTREWLHILYEEKKNEEDVKFLKENVNVLKENPLYEHRHTLFQILKNSIDDITFLLSLMDKPSDLQSLLSGDLSEKEVLDIILKLGYGLGRKTRRYNFSKEALSSPIVLRYWKESPSFVAKLWELKYDIKKLSSLWKEKPAKGADNLIADKIVNMWYLDEMLRTIYRFIKDTPIRPIIALIIILIKSKTVYTKNEEMLYLILDLLTDEEFVMVAYWLSLMPTYWIPEWLQNDIKQIDTSTYQPSRPHIDRVVRQLANAI